jgi:hypothetical protein
MPTQTPTLAEIFDRAMHDRLKESFGGWMPARIESYDSATNRASIQILLMDDYEDEEGERQTEPFPVLNDVPVGFISLGGKFCIRTTVSVGDEGIALFPARPTGKWLNVGGIVDPEDDTPHDFNGALFLPFRLSAGGSNAGTMIEITSSEIKAGGSSSLALLSELNNLRVAHNTHTHPSNGSTPTVGLVGSPYSGTQKLKGGFIVIELLLFLAILGSLFKVF